MTTQTGNSLHSPTQSKISHTQPSIQVKLHSPYEVIRGKLKQVSAKEKVKILENVFRQDRFAELEEEQLNALFTILEQAKTEVRIAESAYKQGELSLQKKNLLLRVAVSIVFALSALFVVGQLTSNSTHQSTLTKQESR